MAKFLCAKCHQEIYCDETHTRRVCSFCATRGKRSGRLPEEPSPWNEYATRVLEDAPAREEELGIGRPEWDGWRRCGDSKFYVNDDGDRFFIDPIGLVTVSVIRRGRQPQVSVVKRWVEELTPNTFSILNTEAQKRIQSWLQRVVGSFDPRAEWKPSLLAALDADPTERDALLNSLSTWFMESDQRFHEDGSRVKLNEVHRLMREFGIPPC